MSENLGDKEELNEEFETLDDLEKVQQGRNDLRSLVNDKMDVSGQREKIALYSNWAAKRLERDLGIKLSNIEAVQLRNTVERLMPQFEKEMDLISKGEMAAICGFEMEEEAAALWLFETYGLREKDFHRGFVIDDTTEQKKYIFPDCEEQAAKKRVVELEENGHDVYLSFEVTPEFKEDLRKLREAKHHNF